MLTRFRLDRGLFRPGLLELQAKVFRKEHTSIAAFSNDVVQVINSQFGNSAGSISELISLVSGRAEDMKPEDRDRRTLARRIVKGIEPLIEEATRKEAELHGRPYAEQIREMDEALLSRRGSLAQSLESPVIDTVELKHEVGIASPAEADVEMADAATTVQEPTRAEETVKNSAMPAAQDDLLKENGLEMTSHLVSASTPPASTNGFRHELHANGVGMGEQGQQVEPPTPPMSLEGHSQSLQSEGGIPWYVTQFDPEGTTIFEERWTGPEVLREMSEELSEMDEDELQGLGAVDDFVGHSNGAAIGDEDTFSKIEEATTKKRILRSTRNNVPNWGTRSLRNREV